jgi:methionyl aminopeptidase
MDFILKTPQEIKLMAQGGRKLAVIRDQLAARLRPGVTLASIEALAQKLIKQAGGQPSFAMVDDYRWATCINLNQGVVHGVPDQTVVKAGDLVSLDVGLFYQGFHSDTSVSFIAGESKNPKTKKFLAVGRKALQLAINQARPGNRLGHISQAIQQTVESAGYSSVRQLTGHGIGRTLHEPPAIPCFLDQPLEQTLRLQPGLALAIEVIYAFGSPEIVTDPDDHWTISTQDGQLAAIFEQTIAVTAAGPQVLTQLPTSQTGKILL